MMAVAQPAACFLVLVVKQLNQVRRRRACDSVRTAPVFVIRAGPGGYFIKFFLRKLLAVDHEYFLRYLIGRTVVVMLKLVVCAVVSIGVGWLVVSLWRLMGMGAAE